MEHFALELFFQNYLPAGTVRDAQEMLTIDEILELMWRNGVQIERDELHAWLLDKGFNEEMISPMKTVWLLKKNDL